MSTYICIRPLLYFFCIPYNTKYWVKQLVVVFTVVAIVETKIVMIIKKIMLFIEPYCVLGFEVCTLCT